MAWAAAKAHHGIAKTSSVLHSDQWMPSRQSLTSHRKQQQIPKFNHIAGVGTQGKSLVELPDGPYFVLASMLDAASLCCSDASCRMLYGLNRANIGPWRELGARTFHGLELDHHGLFEEAEQGRHDTYGMKLRRVDWKGRVGRFHAETQMFSPPFVGSEITSVPRPDEVAYFRCRLCTDVLKQPCGKGRYFEVHVVKNPNNLSMAVVDFEAGGCSSVTFSADTGAVIRESKVQEAPRKVEGAYIQPLSVVPDARPFCGFMGIYVHQGRLAFFRRCATGSMEDGDYKLWPWETTGFISDLSWAEGQRLTPCLAFRDEGAYHVRFTCVGTEPPVGPEQATVEHSHGDAQWKSFDWEGEELEA